MSTSSNYEDAYTAAVRFSRREKLPVSSIHPTLRFTRLGAHLRELATEDHTGGHLAHAALVGQHADGTIGLHDEPLELMPLHLLRDWTMDNPSHPIATAFNWERLPEKVALDGVVRDWSEDLANRIGYTPHSGVASIIYDPDSDFHGKNHRVDDARDYARIKGHGWATRDDIKHSARRVWLQHSAAPPPGDDEYSHNDLLSEDHYIHHAERY